MAVIKLPSTPLYGGRPVHHHDILIFIVHYVTQSLPQPQAEYLNMSHMYR